MFSPPEIVTPLAPSPAPEIPTSLDLKTFFLGGVFLLLALSALHAASEIAIPFVLALILKFLFHPIIRRGESNHLSRKLVSLLIVGALLASIIGIGTALYQPAVDWSGRIQQNYPEIRERLDFLRKPALKTQKILMQADAIGTPVISHKMVAVVEGATLSDKIIDASQALAAGLFLTLLLLLFMLTAGDTFLRRFVEILPRFQDKRQAVTISNEIERDISRYLLTISGMNVAVGAGTALVMYIAGVEDPLLWGTVAFLLNYVPVIGPLSGVGLFMIVGIIAADDPSWAFMPAACYFILHLLEGTLITPLLLAKRFTLNPVLVISSLIFWYWLWGIPGAIMAMPMLAALKIICDRIERLVGFGHFLEG